MEKVKQVCGVPTELFTKRWQISSQFHGLLVLQRQFRWEYRERRGRDLRGTLHIVRLEQDLLETEFICAIILTIIPLE